MPQNFESFFFKVYLFILKERERERELVHRGGEEREGERENAKQAPSSGEPDAGLELRTVRS